MKASDLLPASNSTVWEKTMADVMAGGLLLTGHINDIRGTKLNNPPPSFLPYLIYEYGLGELTPYVPNLYDLINEGIDWQRLRGTPAALATGLGWLDYTAVLEEADPDWRYWNLFQLELDRIRDEFADLERIDGIATLSVPVRSKFWRGYHEYDIRPLVYGQNSWGETHFSEYSGVRTRANGPLWSFGRTYEFDTYIERSELELLDAWVEPDWTEYSSELGWGDFTWNETSSSWESGTSENHAQAMAGALYARGVWVAFMDADGDVIGYRRPRAFHYVLPTVDGPYQIDGMPFTRTADINHRIYIEAMTDFGDGNGQVAAQVALCFGGTLAAGVKPGTRWALPGQLLDLDPPVVAKAVSIEMGESIRHRVKFMLRLDGAYELPLSMVVLGDEPEGFVVDFTDDSYAEKI